jgi:hypothetical protein
MHSIFRSLKSLIHRPSALLLKHFRNRYPFSAGVYPQILVDVLYGCDKSWPSFRLYIWTSGYMHDKFLVNTLIFSRWISSFRWLGMLFFICWLYSAQIDNHSCVFGRSKPTDRSSPLTDVRREACIDTWPSIALVLALVNFRFSSINFFFRWISSSSCFLSSSGISSFVSISAFNLEIRLKQDVTVRKLLDGLVCPLLS